MNQAASNDHRNPSRGEWLTVIVMGCCLAAFVWRGLVAGGGLVGGDTYPYFFPQKQVLAQAFSHGEFPLWHDRTSLGYPLHAESQAGVFYPTNQIVYRLLDVNTAYSLSVLLHYAAAFVFTWRFARSQSLSSTSSMLAALIFVYGWFPVRVSLEWSIIGGVWFPLCLWMLERLLQKPTVQRWACLAICLGLHLLAGHFTLAFITQLTCLTFAFLTSPSKKRDPQTSTSSDQRQAATLQVAGERVLNRWMASGLVFAAIAGAVLLAAVQLIPTFELRQLSQRDGTHSVFNPAYGHLPPVYLTQMVASWWYWHTPEMAMSREMLKFPFLMSPADTNPVEAHLYIGLIPLVLLLIGISSGEVRRRLQRTNWKSWSFLSLAGVVYAFGWFVPLFRHLPGFGFFMGPGRYTMITTLGLAVIAGLVLDVLQRRQRFIPRVLLTLTIAAMTLADLLASAQYPVCDAQVVAQAPLDGLSDSWIAKELQSEDSESPVRLLCGGPNIGNLFGVSSVPQYLGLGPAEYFSDNAIVSTQPDSDGSVFPSESQLQRIRALAITHILTTEPVSALSPACELVLSGPDAFLNRVWGRGSADCFLYRMKEPGTRISSQPKSALANVSIQHRQASDVDFQVELVEPAEVTLVDLMFPGWVVTVDGQAAMPESQAGFGRVVKIAAGKHTVRWQYKPQSFRLGALLSLCALSCMIAASWRRKNSV